MTNKITHHVAQSFTNFYLSSRSQKASTIVKAMAAGIAGGILAEKSLQLARSQSTLISAGIGLAAFYYFIPSSDKALEDFARHVKEQLRYRSFSHGNAPTFPSPIPPGVVADSGEAVPMDVDGQSSEGPCPHCSGNCEEPDPIKAYEEGTKLAFKELQEKIDDLKAEMNLLLEERKKHEGGSAEHKRITADYNKKHRHLKELIKEKNQFKQEDNLNRQMMNKLGKKNVGLAFDMMQHMFEQNFPNSR